MVNLTRAAPATRTDDALSDENSSEDSDIEGEDEPDADDNYEVQSPFSDRASPLSIENTLNSLTDDWDNPITDEEEEWAIDLPLHYFDLTCSNARNDSKVYPKGIDTHSITAH